MKARDVAGAFLADAGAHVLDVRDAVEYAGERISPEAWTLDWVANAQPGLDDARLRQLNRDHCEPGRELESACAWAVSDSITY
jgi:rhodanese-related sulfurtransferase